LVRDAPPLLRVGYTTTSALDVPVDPACVAAVEEACCALQAAGHDVLEITLTVPDTDALWRLLACRYRRRPDDGPHQLHTHGGVHRHLERVRPARPGVPTHHDASSGLPVGVQVVAPAWRDDLCLQVAAQLEDMLPWRDRRPAIA
jgi:Asp-tRNA(Asn)/Glu-tRNA(Gln) amidotransferase A subunit family amidase